MKKITKIAVVMLIVVVISMVWYFIYEKCIVCKTTDCYIKAGKIRVLTHEDDPSIPEGFWVQKCIDLNDCPRVAP